MITYKTNPESRSVSAGSPSLPRAERATNGYSGRRHSLARLGALLLAIGLLASTSSSLTPVVSADAPPRLAAEIMNIGEPWRVRLRGEPGRRFAILLDTEVAGSRETRAGTLCLDLRSGLHVLVNSLTGEGPVIGPEGRFILTEAVPNNPRFLGLAPYLQAVVEDPTAPSGLTISNCLRRVLGNGSTGDFRKKVVDLPWDQLLYADDLEVGDFDADGDLDLAVAAIRDIGHPRGYGGELRLLLNDGQGNFLDGTEGETTGIPYTDDDGGHSAAGDVDSDGDLDLVQIGTRGGWDYGQAHLFLNNGAGLFTDGTFGTDTGLPHDRMNCTWDLIFGDIDRDGDLDLVLGGNSCSATRAWINTNGRGLFVETYGTPDARFPDMLFSGYIELGDVNGDGAVDVLIEYADNQPLLFLNDGRGYFHEAVEGDEAGLPYLENRLSGQDAVFADFDGDGDQDLFIASNVTESGPSRDVLLINTNGRGLYELSDTLPPGRDISSGAATGDVDRDGDLDLVVDSGYYDQLLFNDGRAIFTDMTNGEDTGIDRLAEIAFEIRMADFDADGDLDLAMAFERWPEEGVSLKGVKILFNE